MGDILSFFILASFPTRSSNSVSYFPKNKNGLAVPLQTSSDWYLGRRPSWAASFCSFHVKVKLFSGLVTNLKEQFFCFANITCKYLVVFLWLLKTWKPQKKSACRSVQTMNGGLREPNRQFLIAVIIMRCPHRTEQHYQDIPFYFISFFKHFNIYSVLIPFLKQLKGAALGNNVRSS